MIGFKNFNLRLIVWAELFKQETEVCIRPLALEFMEVDALNGVNGQEARDSGQRGKLLYPQSLDLAYAQASRPFRSEGMNYIGRDRLDLLMSSDFLFFACFQSSFSRSLGFFWVTEFFHASHYQSLNGATSWLLILPDGLGLGIHCGNRRDHHHGLVAPSL